MTKPAHDARLSITLAGMRFNVRVGILPHEREHVVQKSVSRPGVDERQDVWVVEPSGDLDLGEEPLGAEDRPELGAEHLERDLAVVLEVPGQVDRGHAASPELPLDPIAIAEHGGEAVRCGGHSALLIGRVSARAE